MTPETCVVVPIVLSVFVVTALSRSDAARLAAVKCPGCGVEVPFERRQETSLDFRLLKTCGA